MSKLDKICDQRIKAKDFAQPQSRLNKLLKKLVRVA